MLVVLLHLAKPLLDMVETGLKRHNVRSSGCQRAVPSQGSQVSHYGASTMPNTLRSSGFSGSRLRMASGWRLCRVACPPVLVQVATASVLLSWNAACCCSYAPFYGSSRLWVRRSWQGLHLWTDNLDSISHRTRPPKRPRASCCNVVALARCFAASNVSTWR